MTAAVQARLDLVALEGGVARFGSGPTAHAVAVLDVVEVLQRERLRRSGGDDRGGRGERDGRAGETVHAAGFRAWSGFGLGIPA